MSYRILTIDPGSTSTKIGVFDDEKMLFEENLHHSAEELAQFETIPQQEAFRRRLVLKALEEHHIPLESLSAVCGRGGVLKPVHGGTYLTTMPAIWAACWPVRSARRCTSPPTSWIPPWWMSWRLWPATPATPSSPAAAFSTP